MLLGALFRVAYALTASMGGVLPETRMERSDDRLTLLLPGDLAGLRGERLTKRLGALAKLVNCQTATVSVHAG